MEYTPEIHFQRGLRRYEGKCTIPQDVMDIIRKHVEDNEIKYVSPGILSQIMRELGLLKYYDDKYIIWKIMYGNE